MAIEEGMPVGESERVGVRPDPNADPAEWYRLLQTRRQARQRTLQLTEWLGFLAIVVGVESLLGVAWGLVALGIALVVVANAS